MILLASEPLTFKEINKLPKFNDHYKIKTKLLLIKELANHFSKVSELKKFNINDSLFENDSWTLFFYEESVTKIEYWEDLFSLVEYFNISKNENIIFIRYLNVLKMHLDNITFTQIIDGLNNSKNSTLRANISQYLLYSKLKSEIMAHVKNDN